MENGSINLYDSVRFSGGFCRIARPKVAHLKATQKPDR
jgi:hypothetical protein